MNTTNSVVGAGIVVTAGRWSEGKGIDLRVVIGVTVLALGLSFVSGANEKLAQSFGTLILVAALMRYTIPIAAGVGLSRNTKPLGTIAPQTPSVIRKNP